MAPRNFDLGDHLLGLGAQAKTLGSPKGSLKFSLEHSLDYVHWPAYIPEKEISPYE